MATRDELIQKLAQRRYSRTYAPNLTRVQVRQAAQQMTDAEWDAIIAQLKPDGDPNEVGLVLARRVKAYLFALAVADVTAWLADDSITTDQLLELI